MSGKRKRTSQPNSKSSSPVPPPSPKTNETASFPSTLTEGAISRQGTFDMKPLQFPPLSEHFSLFTAYTTSMDRANASRSPLSPQSQHQVLSMTSTRLEAALPMFRSELEKMVSESKIHLERVMSERSRLEEWAKAQFNNLNLTRKADLSKCQRRRSSVEIFSPASDKPSVSTLKIKKTETGEFKVTSQFVSPTKSEHATDAEFIHGSRVPSEAGSNMARRGTGSKNLSRIQNASSKAAQSTSTSRASSTTMKKDKIEKISGSTKPTSAKPSLPNQTSATVFWNYIEPYFRMITDEDLKWLESNHALEADADYLVIPPLGVASPKDSTESKSNGNVASGPLGSLTSRLLASLIEAKAVHQVSFKEEDASSNEDSSFGNGPSSSPIRKNATDDSVVPVSLTAAKKTWIDVEDRIKEDLTSLGVLSPESSADMNENDEICGHLRQLQSQLRIQSALNKQRKKKLYETVLSQLSAQEYYHVLQEIDKQVEQTFAKRYKKDSKKKKKPSLPPKSEAEEICYDCVTKRRFLVESFSAIIPSREERQAQASTTSCFGTLEEAKWIEEEIKLLPFPIIAAKTFAGRQSLGTVMTDMNPIAVGDDGSFENVKKRKPQKH